MYEEVVVGERLLFFFNYDMGTFVIDRGEMILSYPDGRIQKWRRSDIFEFKKGMKYIIYDGCYWLEVL